MCPIIKLGLADDHTAFRQALRSYILNYDFLSLIFQAQDGIDLLDKLATCLPDVLLLDIKMPRLDGLKALAIIHDRYPDVRVLVFTGFIDEAYVLESMKYGVNGYLSKLSDLHEVIRAIQVAYQNEVYMTNLLANSYLRKYVLEFKKNILASEPEFTLEELQIIHFLHQEMTTEEISHEIGLSRRSVELKRDKIKEKAHVKTVGGLLLYAYKRGIIF